MLTRRILLSLTLAAAALCGCGGPPSDGLEKYPASGSVLVNGEPAAGVAVSFHNRDPKAPGNAARPVGVTDAAGRFVLSTNADKDGAVAGDYDVTFFWGTDPGPLAADRLAGRFATVAQSKTQAKLAARPNNLEPFRLEIDPKILQKTAQKAATAKVQ